jgi:hypothetical protein
VPPRTGGSPFPAQLNRPAGTRIALDRAGILTARQHGAARALTPERLAAEIQPGRTGIDIAAACGVSPSTISKYARQHGLTTWRHATAVQQLATMTVPADPDVITAIRGRGENLWGPKTCATWPDAPLTAGCSAPRRLPGRGMIFGLWG